MRLRSRFQPRRHLSPALPCPRLAKREPRANRVKTARFGECPTWDPVDQVTRTVTPSPKPDTRPGIPARVGEPAVRCVRSEVAGSGRAIVDGSDRDGNGQEDASCRCGESSTWM